MMIVTFSLIRRREGRSRRSETIAGTIILCYQAAKRVARRSAGKTHAELSTSDCSPSEDHPCFAGNGRHQFGSGQ